MKNPTCEQDMEITYVESLGAVPARPVHNGCTRGTAFQAGIARLVRTVTNEFDEEFTFVLTRTPYDHYDYVRVDQEKK